VVGGWWLGFGSRVPAPEHELPAHVPSEQQPLWGIVASHSDAALVESCASWQPNFHALSWKFGFADLSSDVSGKERESMQSLRSACGGGEGGGGDGGGLGGGGDGGGDGGGGEGGGEGGGTEGGGALGGLCFTCQTKYGRVSEQCARVCVCVYVRKAGFELLRRTWSWMLGYHV